MAQTQSWLVSVIVTCCIGLVSGAAGGQLLGTTAVAVLQSLELLAENRLLMDQLGNYTIANDGPFESLARRHMPQRDDPMLNTYISVLVEMFGVFNLIVSLSVGICIGLSTYALVIKKHGQPIVTLQSPSSNHISRVVLEGIFVGVLTSQQFRVAVGMSLFVSWQKGGAGTICFLTAGCGTTVLAAIKAALPVLGPGPTIGALMGVAGAVGVSLAAAGALTDQYGQVYAYKLQPSHCQ
ncbi:hypothetical protein PAMP_011654 [Pampus punctatissimus]